MKKTTSKICAFFRRPRIINPKFKNNVELLRITNADEVHDTLGISNERLRVLNRAIEAECRDDEKGATDSLISLSKLCNHQNELAYCVMSYSINKWRMSQPSLLDMLTGGLRK